MMYHGCTMMYHGWAQLYLEITKIETLFLITTFVHWFSPTIECRHCSRVGFRPFTIMPLINRYLQVLIKNAELTNPRYHHGAYIIYSTKGDDNQTTKTPTVRGSLNPQFNHTRIISFSFILQDHLDFFETGCITFFVYGVQKDEIKDPRLTKMTTKASIIWPT